MTDQIGFFSALGLGALHSLEPGHGKGIMGSYLAVSRSTVRDVLALGITSALTHTAVVLAGGFALHTAAGAVSTGSGIPGAQFQVYLKLVSGILIVAIGLSMFRRVLAAKGAPACGCAAHGSPRRGRPGTGAGAFMVGLSNGLMPCPGSLAVILMSINTGTLWKGLWVVLAFGIGGAISLVMVGLLFARLSHFAGFSSGRGGLVVTLASACLITAIGLFTFAGSLF